MGIAGIADIEGYSAYSGYCRYCGYWSCPLISTVYTPCVYKDAGIADIGIHIIHTDLIFMRDQSYEHSELIVNSLLTPDWLRNWTPTINRNIESSCPAAE